MKNLTESFGFQNTKTGAVTSQVIKEGNNAVRQPVSGFGLYFFNR